MWNYMASYLLSWQGSASPVILLLSSSWGPQGMNSSCSARGPAVFCLKTSKDNMSTKWAWLCPTKFHWWTLKFEHRVIFTCHEIFFFFSTPPLQKSKTTVNYKLAFTKSNANDWIIKAFAICLYGDWTPICYSCWPSTTPEGVQGGVRHSVLQGIWWDRSLDSWMFLGTDFIISILASPHI